MAFDRIKELLAQEVELSGFEGEVVDRLQMILDEVNATEQEGSQADPGINEDLEKLKADLETLTAENKKIRDEFKRRFLGEGAAVEEQQEESEDSEESEEVQEDPETNITIDDYLKEDEGSK